MRSPSRCARRDLIPRGARWLSALLLLLLAVAGCVIPSSRHDEEDSEPDPRAEARGDVAYATAEAALLEGRTSRADSLLRPAMDDPTRRTAWVVLLSAEIASASDNWPRVDTLLRAGPLGDPRVDALAQLLLARRALELNDPRAAIGYASTARLLAADPRAQGRAVVFLARAHERLGARDTARAAYVEAAKLLRPIDEWLELRAAALTRDSAQRARHYAALWNETAKRHAAYAEAQLLERNGRPRAAIPLYERAKAPIAAMRLRAATAAGPEARERSRLELVQFVEKNSGNQDARFAIEMLDAGRYRLTADEEMIVARSAAVHGPLSRARTALSRAFAVRSPTMEERFFQVEVLAESGPTSRRQAEQLLLRIRKPSPWAGRAALERAKLIRRRAQTAAGRAAARTALRDVVRLFPEDTAAAPGALMILAEMATDDRRDPAARDAYLSVARKYPTSEHATRARLEAAILAFAARQYRTAGAELDSLIDLSPPEGEASAAYYWSGRAHLAMKDTTGARDRWNLLLLFDSTSYYASLGARRLGVEPWAPRASPDTFTTFRDIDAALKRAALLESVGMDYEARLELDGLEASADTSAARVLTVGNAFRARGNMRRAMQLGRRAIALGATDARAYRLVYPVGEAELLASEAARKKLDPALVAALIRQESSFEARATSPVGARGLMQVMPRVGAALARGQKIKPWNTSMLYDPDINIRLGVVHLRSFTDHYSHESFALAAYNAGGSRVTRWSSRPGGRDAEVFVERIRFPETRGYVRTVLRSRDLYAALYDWERLSAVE